MYCYILYMNNDNTLPRQDYQSILSSIKARLPNIEVIPVNGRDADNTAFNYLSLILNKVFNMYTLFSLWIF